MCEFWKYYFFINNNVIILYFLKAIKLLILVFFNFKLLFVEFKVVKEKVDGVEGVVEIFKEGFKEDIIKVVVDNVKW